MTCPNFDLSNLAKMRIISFIVSFLAFANLFAQQTKGAGALPADPSDSGKNWALVVGVSNYQDAHIPDLKFADRDASEFVSYLKSKSGGQLKDEQIMVLTNEKATHAQIYGALDWLLEVCKPNDQVLIYFSGHGDVETKTMRQQGYLLAYDTPPTNYRIGGVRLEDLNDYLETIVQKNQCKIVLITDACRSGNLAGGREGVLSTASALSAQFQNQIKIMSCQPNELSLEGEQWDGGRGAFSFHLLDGLMGMADGNKDQQVTLFELDRYLLETVPAETDQKQFPNTTGNKGAHLSSVDTAELAVLKVKRAEARQMSKIAPKGLEAELLANADTTVQQLYAEFLAAVDGHYFLPSDQKANRQPGRSASELYDRLKGEPALEPMRHIMKRNFAAALQDESQQAINAYLRADQAELEARWNTDIDKFKTNPVYITKAASLLGESHVLYPQLLAKQYYFEGLIKRLEGMENNQPSLFEEALALENKALEYDSDAAYIYNEIGLIYDEIRLPDQAGNQQKNRELFQKQIDTYQMAMSLTPRWVMPVYNISRTYKEWRRLNEAEEMGLKAIHLDSNFVDAYYLLGEVYYLSSQQEKLKLILKQTIQLSPNDKLLYFNIACIESLQNNSSEALSWLEKAIQHGSNYDAIQNDGDLENVRRTKEYELLIQQYFPEKK